MKTLYIKKYVAMILNSQRLCKMSVRMSFDSKIVDGVLPQIDNSTSQNICSISPTHKKRRQSMI